MLALMPLLALSAPVGRSLQDPPLPKKPGLPGVTPAMKAASPSTSNLGFLRSKMTTWFCKDNDANNVACDFYRFSQALKAETDATKRQEMLKARQADYMSMSTEAKKAKTTAAREGWSRMYQSYCATHGAASDVCSDRTLQKAYSAKPAVETAKPTAKA